MTGWVDLGGVLRAEGRLEESLACYRAHLRDDPADARCHARAAAVLSELGRVAEAIDSYQQALAHNPDFPEACNNLAHAWLQQGEVARAVEACREALRRRPRYPKAHSNLLFALHCEDFDPLEMFAEHRRWAVQNEPRLPIDPHANRPVPERRLRIGYVSAALGRAHPVASFLAPVLRCHDRRRFEVNCYGCSPRDDRHLAGLADRWRDLHGMPDEDAARLIRADGIDILVDLDGHSAGNRLTLFARKPAPVQVTWLGYADTTGLLSIDYRITDRQADPPGRTEYLHTERLVRLPAGFLCYGPPDQAPPVAPLPALEAGAFTFGAFHHPVKLSRRVVETWAAILGRVPGSRLLLHHCAWDLGDVLSRTVERFAAVGVASNRLEFVGSVPDPQRHLRVYSQADLALDAFPYNGTATTCEALWMGVPVVTLEGAVHISRVGVSLLSGVGLDSLAAANTAQYLDLAVRLASDLESLNRIRRSLRRRMAASALTDAPGFTRRLERAYRVMWRRWCSGCQ